MQEKLFPRFIKRLASWQNNSIEKTPSALTEPKAFLIDRKFAVLACHINKYSPSVSRAVFCSSLQSPAMSRGNRTTKRSPVSKSFGSSCRRKESTLAPDADDFPGLVFSGGQGRGDGGAVWINCFWWDGCSGDFAGSGLLSATRFFR